MGALARYPSLAGRPVMITGGASGIGAAMVEAFAEQGARVGCIDIDEAAAARLCERLGDGVELWFRRLDVTDVPALKRAVVDFAEAVGGLGVLINNVANDTRHEPLQVTEEHWRACLAVNLDAAFFASQVAVSIMREAGGGSIVNLSSINALLGPGQMPGYVTAKAGLLGLTKALARDFGADSIRVNSILPGWVVTDRQLDNWLTPEAEAEWMQQVALDRRILPRDVANLALFLAADDSALITNQHFVIDGGRT